ncbi:MAG: hypothetical protein ABUS57_08580 [Pseudomonadota bacterium]
MIYLIDQHIWLLLVVLGFAAAGGWAFAALTARPREQAVQRERERLMREVLNANLEGGGGSFIPVSPEQEREMESLRRRAELDAGRIAELERGLEAARARADEASSRAAEAERGQARAHPDDDELQRLRAEAAANAAREERTVEVQPLAAPVADDERAAQSWRLRYFEQRVRYLEAQRSAQPAPALMAPQPAPAPTDDQALRELDWRARYAESRARHLEQALRNATPAEPGPTDDLSTWRMSYLEKRLAHAQGAETPEPAEDLEAERLKWRNRYLEARLRRIESLLAAKNEAPADATLEPLTQAPQPVEPEPEEVAVAPAPEPIAAPVEAHEEEEEAAPAPLVPAGAEERPPSMPAARNGAPDDFTLIEGVSPMLQTTLNSLGVYHFEQIAHWSPANIAWLDQYLRLRGRIVQEEWVEQAEDLAREGVAAARRVPEDEYA